MDKFLEALENFIKSFGTSVLESVVLLLLGVLASRLITRIIRRLMSRTRFEGTAASFIISLIRAAIALVIFFTILKIFKIDTTSIVAIAAASGLAIGLALQDSISNIAGGAILLLTKPFKENDSISIGGTEGKIKKIKIMTTEILTADNVVITVPNNKVTVSEIRNFSAKPTRRIDIEIPASYKEDAEKVKSVLVSVMTSDDRILEIPKPSVEISDLAQHAIKYKVKFWTANENYWDVKNGFYEKVLSAFLSNGVELPYNKLYYDGRDSE